MFRNLVHRNYSLSIFILFASLFVVTASGRLGSGDAAAQLQAATAWARTGSPALIQRPQHFAGLWVRSPDGRLFQCHDPGNLLLMLPGAWMGSLVDHRDVMAAIEEPPASAKLIVALEWAIVAAFGGWNLWRAFAHQTNRRSGLLLALMATLCTMFWPYAKTSWDVLGGCVGVCWVLAEASALLVEAAPGARRHFQLGLAFGFAILFRYSLLPFLGIGVVALVYLGGTWRNARHLAALALGAGATISVNLVYNFIRMGNALTPATTARQFSAVNGLNGPLLDGLAAQFLSPNKGLFFASPLCLLLLVGLPLLVRDRKARDGFILMSASFLPGVFLYILMISKMTNGTPFGWGPRYLLPVLPILCLPIARLVVVGWRRKWIRFLVAAGFVANIAPVLANWNLVAEGDYSAVDRWTWPVHAAKTWEAVWMGIRNPMGDGTAAALFPDSWLVRAWVFSPGSRPFVGIFCLVLCSMLAWLLRETLRERSGG